MGLERELKSNFRSEVIAEKYPARDDQHSPLERDAQIAARLRSRWNPSCLEKCRSWIHPCQRISPFSQSRFRDLYGDGGRCFWMRCGKVAQLRAATAKPAETTQALRWQYVPTHLRL